MEEKRLCDFLDIAIQREIEAFDFYSGLSEKVTDRQAKDALSGLASEEKKHRAFLENYRDGKIEAGSLRMSHVVDYRIAEHMEKPATDSKIKSSEAYLLAAHREKASHDFYKALADIHPDGPVREMLLLMASEEMRHKEKVEYLYSNTAFPQTDGG
ncbi:MAG TPA: ferritin family protein [Desulfomonilia bacterium]